jgi:hypothetical protein
VVAWAQGMGRVAVLAIGLLTVASVTLAVAPASVQKRLEEVRVCGASALDRRAGVCTRDESRRPIVSSAFNCSARAQAEPGERFAGRFLYRGQPFPAFGTSVGDRRRGVYVYLTAGPNPMPGGPWACELRVGPERARKSFRSGGPTAPILHVAACRTSRTVSAGPTRVCRRDESRTSFRSTDSVTCSAVFAGGKGKFVGIEFLREGKEVFAGDFELPLPVTAAGPRLDPDPRLQRGAWACRWSLAGRVLAVKPFRIT